jgi:hypothetical protein
MMATVAAAAMTAPAHAQSQLLLVFGASVTEDWGKAFKEVLEELSFP